MKKKRLLMLIGSVCLALMLLVPLAVSCGPATPEEAAEEIAALESKLAAEKSKVSSLGDDVSDLEEEIAALRVPAEVFEWRLSNLGPRVGLPVVVAEAFEKDVFAMSGGRLKVTTYYAGELVGEMETFQSAASGLAEMAFPYNPAYAGLIPCAQIEMGLPGADCNQVEQQAWFWEFKDGVVGEIFREAYAEQGTYWINFGNQIPAILVSKEPITGMDDLAGKKVRALGLFGDFMAKVGAQPTAIAFNEIYTAMATGVIDAGCGFNMVDYWDLKFFEICPYLLPLNVGPGNGGPLVVNMDAWNSLPDDLKAIVEVAAKDNCWLESRAYSYFALTDWLLIQEGGAVVGPAWSTADTDEWRAGALSLWDDFATKDDYCAQLIPLLKEYMKELGVLK